jgi:hypothetical protein
MSRSLSLAAVPAIALLGLAAVPAASSAATIAPSAPCYSTLYQNGKLSYQPMTGTITGGTPGGRFQIYGVGGKAGSQVGTFDAAGNASYTISSYSNPGINPSAGRTVKLEVTEFVAGASPITGSASVKVSTISVDVESRPSNPLRARVVRASGTPFANQSMYGFVVRGSKSSKVLKRISLGKANECGYVRRKSVVAPRSYRTGSYRLYINAGKSLKKSQAIAYGFRITRRSY